MMFRFFCIFRVVFLIFHPRLALVTGGFQRFAPLVASEVIGNLNEHGLAIGETTFGGNVALERLLGFLFVGDFVFFVDFVFF